MNISTTDKRPYQQKKRAEQAAETRRRIVEAAVELHSIVGPARATLSMIAEKAGVQRHTLYAHFPDERCLYMACSGLALERDPLPNADDWRGIADKRARLAAGLGALYGWYARNADLAACVLRDAEFHAPTQEIVALRMGPPMAAMEDVLGDELAAKQRALLHLALSFFTWRSLTQESGVDQETAIAVMVDAIGCAAPCG
jgi:AcrR family transcriptional regulator